MSRWIVSCLLLVVSAKLEAQTWDTDEARALVTRAVERRATVEGDAAHPYQIRAHGLVLFGHQLESDSRRAAPPRLTKADELLVEVYWQAPGQSKQRIVAWRDTTVFPTDIRYHRDHLGLVLDEFGPVMTLGQGQEVRGVAHPFSPAGPGHYSFAIGDTVLLRTASDSIVLVAVHIRPQRSGEPGVVGTAYLDLESAALTRFDFSFTATAYRDPTVERIAVVLEQARIEGRWVPWRQQLDILRTAARVALPFRSIIRTRWQVEQIESDVGPPTWYPGRPGIGGLVGPQPGHGWRASFNQVVADSLWRDREDLVGAFEEAERLVGPAELMGQIGWRPGVGSLSQLVAVNRVEGVALGLGIRWTPGGDRGFGLHVRHGTADGEWHGRVTFEQRLPGATIWFRASRLIRDVADPEFANASGTARSILSLGGRELGDYVREAAVGGGITLSGESGWVGDVGIGWERSRSVQSATPDPADSSRNNPALGAGDYGVVRMSWRTGGGPLTLAASGELGRGDSWFGLATAKASAIAEPFVVEALVGGSTKQSPRSRLQPIGGWGTLPGEPYRAYGGRFSGLFRVDLPVPFAGPGVSIGRFGRVNPAHRIGPFVALGWAAGSDMSVPWRASRGIRPVVGVRLSAFFELLVMDLGWAVRRGDVGVSLDLTRSLWPIL